MQDETVKCQQSVWRAQPLVSYAPDTFGPCSWEGPESETVGLKYIERSERHLYTKSGPIAHARTERGEQGIHVCKKCAERILRDEDSGTWAWLDGDPPPWDR